MFSRRTALVGCAPERQKPNVVVPGAQVACQTRRSLRIPHVYTARAPNHFCSGATAMRPSWRLSRSLIGAVLIFAAACRGDDANPITAPAKPAPVEPAVVSLQVTGFAPFVGSSESFQATATL